MKCERSLTCECSSSPMLIAYATGMLTLSRQWITPTYLVLGLAAAAQNVGPSDHNSWPVGKPLHRSFAASERWFFGGDVWSHPPARALVGKIV